jgi:hypothetical protein
MIKTRPTLDDLIAGTGDYLVALDLEELKLIGAILGLVNLGHSGYGDVAHNLVMTIEEAADDPEFCLNSLEEISPKFNVHDPESYEVINIFDHDDISIMV